MEYICHTPLQVITINIVQETPLKKMQQRVNQLLDFVQQASVEHCTNCAAGKPIQLLLTKIPLRKRIDVT
jgi:hypothetical protein